jgi:transposase InsO family protein
VKYAWIQEHSNEFQITVMCKVFNIDRTSYYHWVKSGSIVKKVDTKLNELIEIVFVQGRENYGTRRIKDKLMQRYGLIVSRRRIGHIMRDLGLVAKTKKRYKINTTDSNHNLPVAPNILNRDFYASNTDEKYVGDITYIPTNEGWLYLATVIDLYSRKVVGWSMDDTMKVSLVNDALKMALLRRKPPIGLIWHTDRGSQYASYSHKDLLEQNGIIQSMSRKGNCWDNAVAESFFHTLKTELIYHEVFETKSQANRAIFEYIEVYYNRQRMHSANGNLSPVEFEEKMMLHYETAA